MPVFLDTERAFDTVWHEGLFVKLSQLGVNPSIVRFIASYLEQPFFRVQV